MKIDGGRAVNRVVIVLLAAVAFNVCEQRARSDEVRPGNPVFYEEGLYQIFYHSDGRLPYIGTASGKKSIRQLAEYDYYESGGVMKIKLVSRLGFTFDNIPMNNLYFYNEAIATFLMAEDYLPQAQAWLKKHGYTVIALNNIHFYFPDNPIIHKKYDYTRFWWQADWYWNMKRQAWVRYGNKWVLGYADEYNKIAYVTYGYNDGLKRCIVVHEYIHLCGYDHNEGPFKKGGDLFSAYDSS